MSTMDSSTGRSVKTLAIRLEPDLHAQLSLVAQLRGSTITDEIRTAIDSHLTVIKASPELVGKADSVLEDSSATPRPERKQLRPCSAATARRQLPIRVRGASQQRSSCGRRHHSV